jgi:hypothetical protein
MKRCPQCEFIYEDDQTCCDMDGVDLVFDHPSQQPVAPATTHIKRRSLLAICAVVLGVLVLAIAYASLERAFTVSSEPALVTEASATQTAAQEQPSRPEKVEVAPVGEDPTVSKVSDTAKNSRIAAEDPEAREQAAKAEGSEPLRRNSLGTRGVVLGSIPQQNRIEANRSQPEMVRSATSPAPAKKESKVVSIVKKTGRFFTKPFRQ